MSGAESRGALPMAYIRYSLMCMTLALCTGFFLAGGYWLWGGITLALFILPAADQILGSSRKVYREVNSRVLALLPFLTLPFLLALSMIYLSYFTQGDPFAVGFLTDRALGIDFEASKTVTSAGALVGGGLSLGLLYGAAGTVAAHELTHQIHKPLNMITGRWLLAFTCDTGFAIEHVYGHHRHVGTDKDPATARRGEYILSFVVRSALGQLASVFRFEAARLRNRGISPWSWHNRAARGQLMSLAYFTAAHYAAGWTGVLVFMVLALLGKSYLETVNYVEHYGLIRVPGTRVETRHSWDCYNMISSALLYNLPRHADHHLHVKKPFWELGTYNETPVLPYGYMTLLLIALVPPLWQRLINPRLAEWDKKFASDGERSLIAERGWQLAS